jgi:hypothetical protein
MSGVPVYDGCQNFHPVLQIVLSLLCVNCYRCYELPPESAAQGILAVILTLQEY